MTYHAPLQDMLFVLEDLCDLNAVAELPGLEDAGLCLGAWIMGDAVCAARARVAAGDSGPFLKSKLALAHVYATHVFPKARACHESVISGTDAILNLSPDALQTTSNA